MEKVKNEIIDWLTNYKNTTNCKGVVLGISGGKDSTVVAMLAKKVWKDNVFGVLMPNGEQADISDSLEIVKSIGIDYTIVNVNSAYTSLLDSIESSKTKFDKDIEITKQAKTNIPPRLRMTTLYAIAQSMDYRVIGTGNASETYIGWTTKFGDGGHDLNPIAHLTCTKVMELGKLLAKDFNLDERLVFKTPSDGLTGRSDEDNFGFTYAQLDAYIEDKNAPIPAEIKAKIDKMHALSEHKRNIPLKIK